MPFHLTPFGHLQLDEAELTAASLDQHLTEALRQAQASEAGHGGAALLRVLATQGLDVPLPADGAYWRELARRYFTGLCHLPEDAVAAGAEGIALLVAVPPAEELQALAEAVPPMRGAEYLSAATLAELWRSLDGLARTGITAGGGSVAAWLRGQNRLWHLVGRVTFHLAENKRDPERPFAFLATYTQRISDQAKPQYLPLGRALQEYAGAGKRDTLLALLAPVQRAAARSACVRTLVESQRVFQPQAWTAGDAYKFLRDIPLLEESGVLVRVPDWWSGGQTVKPQVSVTVGGKRPGGMGLDALLDFNVTLSLDGEPLSQEEWAQIQASAGGLILLKGRWVEADPAKLQQVLEHWKMLETARREGGFTLAEGLRLLSGSVMEGESTEAAAAEVRAWSFVNAGDWLAETLAALRDPASSAAGGQGELPPPGLNATLRPYQLAGVAWMRFLTRLGLGACLADDMGLGKTIQVLGLLLRTREERLAKSESAESEKLQEKAGSAENLEADEATGTTKPAPALLVLPASLLGNWMAEAARFAPSLRLLAVHPSALSAEALTTLAQSDGAGANTALAGVDLVLTTYGMLLKQEWLRTREWSLIVLDEAQAIKNPGSRQTRTVKELRAPMRIALTGTPVENSLGDLWSLFDFLNPGLLGGAKAFTTYARRLSKSTEPGAFAPLRRLVRPYILRRLKTDRSVISDLPDKTEVTAHCSLTKKQAVLYGELVRDLAEKLKAAKEGDDAMQRRGLVLASLMRLKQLCNHPAQLTGEGDYAAAASGKFQRLVELCAEISSRQEKVLVFTQFRELTEPLRHLLTGVFGRPGLVLHGTVSVKNRRGLVEQFQAEDGPPFFVLSLKAGGTGLTLTQAAHVIHFDRWWNPAVENQATDRAYRIGQKKNVLVHKFVCRGTLEEKIDRLIASKQALSDEVLGTGAGGETLLTEMRDDELLSFVSLDLDTAMQDE